MLVEPLDAAERSHGFVAMLAEPLGEVFQNGCRRPVPQRDESVGNVADCVPFFFEITTGIVEVAVAQFQCGRRALCSSQAASFVEPVRALTATVVTSD